MTLMQGFYCPTENLKSSRLCIKTFFSPETNNAQSEQDVTTKQFDFYSEAKISRPITRALPKLINQK